MNLKEYAQDFLDWFNENVDNTFTQDQFDEVFKKWAETKNDIPWDTFELWKELIIQNIKQILKDYD